MGLGNEGPFALVGEGEFENGPAYGVGEPFGSEGEVPSENVAASGQGGGEPSAKEHPPGLGAQLVNVVAMQVEAGPFGHWGAFDSVELAGPSGTEGAFAQEAAVAAENGAALWGLEQQDFGFAGGAGPTGMGSACAGG